MGRFCKTLPASLRASEKTSDKVYSGCKPTLFPNGVTIKADYGMRKALTKIDIEQIILMAWGDTISFEAIRREYGLTENEVRKLMRKHQTPKTYRRWRERVEKRSGESSKHEALSHVSSRRQKY